MVVPLLWGWKYLAVLCVPTLHSKPLKHSLYCDLSLRLFLAVNIILKIEILGEGPIAKFLKRFPTKKKVKCFYTLKRIIPPSFSSMLSNSASMSSYSSPVHFWMTGLERERAEERGFKILIILLDVFITKLFLRDPVVSLQVDDIEGLVELKGGPQCLEEQSELPELQIILTVLAVTLQ